MNDTDRAETVAIKACYACGSAVLEREKFCRWCGVRQKEKDEARASSRFSQIQSPYVTSRLDQAGVEAVLYHRVSGPLVEAVVAGVSANTTASVRNRFVKRAVLALISVPIWLMIVLLSPLDAYAAAKAVAEK